MTDKEKVRLQQYVEKEQLCAKCGCGAKSPIILEVTDTHIVQINYLGVREVIDRESYRETMKAAGVYNDALNEFLNNTLPEKEAKARKKLVCLTKKREKNV